MELLVPLVEGGLTFQGYGLLNEIPALYGFLWNTPKLMSTIVDRIHRNPTGGKNFLKKNTHTKISLGIGRKLNVHKTFRGRPNCLRIVLCTFILQSQAFAILDGRSVNFSTLNNTPPTSRTEKF